MLWLLLHLPPLPGELCLTNSVLSRLCSDWWGRGLAAHTAIASRDGIPQEIPVVQKICRASSTPRVISNPKRLKGQIHLRGNCSAQAEFHWGYIRAQSLDRSKRALLNAAVRGTEQTLKAQPAWGCCRCGPPWSARDPWADLGVSPVIKGKALW